MDLRNERKCDGEPPKLRYIATEFFDKRDSHSEGH